MAPGAVACRDLRYLAKRIDRPRVYVARLGADDHRTLSAGHTLVEGFRLHPPLGIDRNALDRIRPETEKPYRRHDGDVSLLADEDADRRSTEEAPLLNVPARLSKHRMPRRRQPREVAHLPTGYEADGGPPREAEELDHPSSADILGDTGRRRGSVDRRVLIPSRCQPVRRQRRRDAAADHEAEVAGASRCDEAAIHAPSELLDDRLGVFARVGQRQVERRAQLLRRSARTDVPVLEVHEVVPRDRDGAVEQARVQHQPSRLYARLDTWICSPPTSPGSLPREASRRRTARPTSSPRGPRSPCAAS